MESREVVRTGPGCWRCRGLSSRMTRAPALMPRRGPNRLSEKTQPSAGLLICCYCCWTCHLGGGVRPLYPLVRPSTKSPGFDRGFLDGDASGWGGWAARHRPSTWGNRGSESSLSVPMEAGGCSPIGWKYGLTTGRRAQASNGEQPWKNILVSTCR
jgi:hypothetical protein